MTRPPESAYTREHKCASSSVLSQQNSELVCRLALAASWLAGCMCLARARLYRFPNNPLVTPAQVWPPKARARTEWQSAAPNGASPKSITVEFCFLCQWISANNKKVFTIEQRAGQEFNRHHAHAHTIKRAAHERHTQTAQNGIILCAKENVFCATHEQASFECAVRASCRRNEQRARARTNE